MRNATKNAGKFARCYPGSTVGSDPPSIAEGQENTIQRLCRNVVAKFVHIMEALKRSMERIPAKKEPATAAATKKKKKVFEDYPLTHVLSYLEYA